MATQRRLEQLLPGMWATRTERPFGDDHEARAFLLRRNDDGDDGRPNDANGSEERRRRDNVLLYANSFVGDYRDHIRGLGKPSHQLLTHRDEASEACNVLEGTTFCHAKEEAAVRAKGARVDQTFDGSEYNFDGDLKAFHAPGHTPGVALYLWRSPRNQSVLFSGDTLYGTSKGELDVAPLFLHAYRGQETDYVATLDKILDLHPDYVVPGLSAAGTFVFPYDHERIRSLRDKMRSSS